MSKENKNKDKANGIPVEDPGAEEKFFNFDKESDSQQEEPPVSEGQAPDETDELRASVQDLKDKQLRLLAEFENYKKRTMRERLELVNSASKDVMLRLLPVLDDFQRAKMSADDPSTEEQFSEGVMLVYNRLNATLQQLGLSPMVSTGEKFDPEWHEAVTEIPVDEDQKGLVVDTIETGYTLNDKIIRHAKVVVGK